MPWNQDSTAPLRGVEKRTFRVTHRFHPLHGREFEVIEVTAVQGVGRVHYTDDDGTLRSIRQAWTSVAAADPFVRVAAGRSAFRVSDLLALAALLDGLGAGTIAPRGRPVDGASTVKEILPHV